jgi:hypothetical protein
MLVNGGPLGFSSLPQPLRRGMARGFTGVVSRKDKVSSHRGWLGTSCPRSALFSLSQLITAKRG